MTLKSYPLNNNLMSKNNPSQDNLYIHRVTDEKFRNNYRVSALISYREFSTGFVLLNNNPRATDSPNISATGVTQERISQLRTDIERLERLDVEMHDKNNKTLSEISDRIEPTRNSVDSIIKDYKHEFSDATLVRLQEIKAVHEAEESRIENAYHRRNASQTDLIQEGHSADINKTISEARLVQSENSLPESVREAASNLIDESKKQLEEVIATRQDMAQHDNVLNQLLDKKAELERLEENRITPPESEEDISSDDENVFSSSSDSDGDSNSNSGSENDGGISTNREHVTGPDTNAGDGIMENYNNQYNIESLVEKINTEHSNYFQTMYDQFISSVGCINFEQIYSLFSYFF